VKIESRLEEKERVVVRKSIEDKRLAQRRGTYKETVLPFLNPRPRTAEAFDVPTTPAMKTRRNASRAMGGRVATPDAAGPKPAPKSPKSGLDDGKKRVERQTGPFARRFEGSAQPAQQSTSPSGAEAQHVRTPLSLGDEVNGLVDSWGKAFNPKPHRSIRVTQQNKGAGAGPCTTSRRAGEVRWAVVSGAGGKCLADGRKKDSRSDADEKFRSTRSGGGDDGSDGGSGSSPGTPQRWKTPLRERDDRARTPPAEDEHGKARSAGSRKAANFCHNCGTRFFVASANFCHECGTRRLVSTPGL
jgi:hypothetical protein